MSEHAIKEAGENYYGEHSRVEKCTALKEYAEHSTPAPNSSSYKIMKEAYRDECKAMKEFPAADQIFRN